MINVVVRIPVFILYVLTATLAVIMVPYLYSRATNRPIYMHPDVNQYYLSFKKDAKLYGVSLNLHKLTTIFSDTVPEATAAYCLPHIKLVVVSIRTWKTLNENGRKALLYHEWGHCILRREHTEVFVNMSFCPKSLMYPYIEPLQSCYNNTTRESYHKELFTTPAEF